MASRGSNAPHHQRRPSAEHCNPRRRWVVALSARLAGASHEDALTPSPLRARDTICARCCVRLKLEVNPTHGTQGWKADHRSVSTTGPECCMAFRIHRNHSAIAELGANLADTARTWSRTLQCWARPGRNHTNSADVGSKCSPKIWWTKHIRNLARCGRHHPEVGRCHADGSKWLKLVDIGRKYGDSAQRLAKTRHKL